MSRAPAVAGQFYRATKAGLLKEVSALIDDKAPRDDWLGGISPHAGYIYSGAVAGKVLSRINYRKGLIILGPNHTGIGAPYACVSVGSWSTPLGDVAINNRLAEAVLDNCGLIEDDPSAHIHEHSIEVQLPFLQLLNKGLSFVPVAISSGGIDTLREIGAGLAKAAAEYGEGVVIIASSDMTHYEDERSARSKDDKAIEAILALDEEALLREVAVRGISMCGCAPAAVMLAALKKLGAEKGELVDYRTSGDVTNDRSSVVGYAGILIK